MLHHIKLKLDSEGYGYEDKRGYDIMCGGFVTNRMELAYNQAPANIVITLSQTKVADKSVAIKLHGSLGHLYSGEYLDKKDKLNHVSWLVPQFCILHNGCDLLVELGYKPDDVVWVTLDEGGTDA
jgi:hypothetical protein